MQEIDEFTPEDTDNGVNISSNSKEELHIFTAENLQQDAQNLYIHYTPQKKDEA